VAFGTGSGGEVHIRSLGSLRPALQEILTDPSTTGARKRDLSEASGFALDLMSPTDQEESTITPAGPAAKGIH